MHPNVFIGRRQHFLPKKLNRKKDKNEFESNNGAKRKLKKV